MKCPGQSTRYWNKDAIFETGCLRCGEYVEFFKDDTYRRCGSCNYLSANPRLDLGCAEYCEHANICLVAKGK